ncbi:conserved hypothetical protein [Aspergillus terreus NIH2624]|uniref:mRNA stability protein n=1 Tax=Aspergillus terreus (strain NIH 2624 / FGSC A1156) TaxID=341663 RepID=Q0CVX6_ASPTN|nr:uncharacterized protein ATEG_02158 [Aspergillus terreus NIH2624]EAU37120.1 conserved hypothetical protein [Aspergillus terreus NIH2624]
MPSDRESLTEDERHILRTYGRLPRQGVQQSKGRQYFDSGDYALSAASKADDSGLTQTGTAHPLRESISRPYAPVPTASNISKDAYKDINVQKSPSPEIVESPLHQRTNAGNNKTEGNEDEQQATAKALNMTDNTR